MKPTTAQLMLWALVFSSTPALAAATQPATTSHSVSKQAEQLVTRALSSRPVDEELLRAVLRLAAQVQVSYQTEGQPYFSMAGTPTTRADPNAESVCLVRQKAGEVPPQWIDFLKAPLNNRPKFVVMLLLSVPEELRDDRTRALAQANEHLRAGLRQLAEKFPFMKNARDWDSKILHPAANSGRPCLGLWLAHSSGQGKAIPSQTLVPEAERFNLLAILAPPQEEVGQLAMSPLLPCLGLEGQCGSQAGNAELAAELKRLLADSLAPLYELDEKAAKIIAAQLPTTPATQPSAVTTTATRPATTQSNTTKRSEGPGGGGGRAGWGRL